MTAVDTEGSVDGVLLTCPNNLRAVSGGFFTESAAVFLNSSFPGEAPGEWEIWVVNLGAEPATWAPTLTCG